jgi:hypothetical protein
MVLQLGNAVRRDLLQALLVYSVVIKLALLLTEALSGRKYLEACLPNLGLLHLGTLLVELRRRYSLLLCGSVNGGGIASFCIVRSASHVTLSPTQPL